MAMASVPQSEPYNEEVWDDLTTLRGKTRRQERAIADLRAEVMSLKALTTNLTAAVAALTDYLKPADGAWVYEEGQPAEYMPCEPRAPRYEDLLFAIPSEVLRNGR